jgi:allantoin racemase
MRIRIVVPIISSVFNDELRKEAAQFKAPDTVVDVVNIDRGPASIESHYDEVVASGPIVDAVVEAEKDGADGVFIDCFGDPGVDAARELVDIPVVGGFQPAALAAMLLARRWSVVTVLKNVLPMIGDLARKMGVGGSLASVRDIHTPVLELQDKKLLHERLLREIGKAVEHDGAEAVVLGCTGMMGLARSLAESMAKKGLPVPVVDPTAAAIGFLELLARGGLSQSRLAYMRPPDKERRR